MKEKEKKKKKIAQLPMNRKIDREERSARQVTGEDDIGMCDIYPDMFGMVATFKAWVTERDTRC